ncbi:hypothetical protein RM780_08080 [Streptomyces sp. DSM 44917]|uniref:Uncharacterized protein n=1 Tax=Streptomyces boetiae TaxID=3075541 RepID=A0ABU2L5S5_9ACTN|nr:hypothetical protein [Streptomyces sp. DSM 44917]MDT0306921.1 hypothetical protein [Streptomyces sp. DSM 44917]
MAEAFRTGRASWPAAGEGVAPGALPLRADGVPLGCPAVAGPEEFDGDRRSVPELTARHVADLLRAGGPEAVRETLSGPGLGALTLWPRAGRAEADERALELFGLAPGASTAERARRRRGDGRRHGRHHRGDGGPLRPVRGGGDLRPGVPAGLRAGRPARPSVWPAM